MSQIISKYIDASTFVLQGGLQKRIIDRTHLSPYSSGLVRHWVQASWNHWPQLAHCSIFRFHLQPNVETNDKTREWKARLAGQLASAAGGS